MRGTSDGIDVFQFLRQSRFVSQRHRSHNSIGVIICYRCRIKAGKKTAAVFQESKPHPFQFRQLRQRHLCLPPFPAGYKRPSCKPMNLQITVIVERAPSPFTVRLNTRLYLQTIAGFQVPAPIILIQIALQLPTALCQHHIDRHCFRLFHWLRYHNNLITHLVLRPSDLQRRLLPFHQQPA